MSTAKQNIPGSKQGPAKSGTATREAQTASDQADFDHLIQKAQELVRGLDTLSTSSAPTAVATPPSSKAEPTNIAELDRVLAAKADAALNDPEAMVQEVLEGVFESQAAIVQSIDAPRPVQPSSGSGKSAASVSSAPVAKETAKPLSPEPVSNAPAAATPKPATTPSAQAQPAYQADTRTTSPAESKPDTRAGMAPAVAPSFVAAPAVQSAVVAGPQPQASTQLPVPAIEQPIAPVLAVQAESPPPHIETSTTMNATPLQSPAPEASGGTPGNQTVETKPASTPLASISILLKPLIAMLVLVNYPLRMVPASLRTAVDWIALSLLVWVPIVWIMVIAFGGVGFSSGQHASSDKPAALHDSSTNSAAAKHEKAEPTHETHKAETPSSHH